MRAGLRILAATALALVAFELGLRLALFSRIEALASLARQLRKPEKFASIDEQVYWQIRWRMGRAGEKGERPPFPHPELGWIGAEIDPRTYEHEAEPRSGGWRPVLVFGDSFARCLSRRFECWEDFLAASPLGEELAVLNYGVNAYGLDQSVMLMQRVLPRFQDRDPLVVLSLLVDDDLDRSGLSLRDWPKPRLRPCGEGGWGFELPPAQGLAEYVAEHPPRVRSYLWRYLLFGSGLVERDQRERWMGGGARVAELEELNRRLLELAAGELEARGLEHFVLVFHGPDALERGWTRNWREPFLLAELDRLGLPAILSRAHLRVAGLERGRDPRQFFVASGPGAGHLAAQGNQVVFGALLRGLRGVFDDAAALRLAHADARADEGSRWRFLLADEDGAPERLVVELGRAGIVELGYELAGTERRLAAELRASGPGAAPGARSAELRVTVDGATAFAQRVSPGQPAVALDLDLGGAKCLELCFRRMDAGEGELVLALVGPRVE